MFVSLVFIFVIFIHVSSAGQPPKVVPFASKLNLKAGNSLELFCSVSDGTKPIKFKWLHDGLEVLPNERIYFESKTANSILIFSHIDLKDACNYTCEAKNAFVTDSQSTFMLVKGLFIILDR